MHKVNGNNRCHCAYAHRKNLAMHIHANGKILSEIHIPKLTGIGKWNIELNSNYRAVVTMMSQER